MKEIFQGLADFGMQRSGKQAVGFYLAYLALAVVLGFATGMVMGLWGYETRIIVRAGITLGTLYCGVLYLIVMFRKGLNKRFAYWLLFPVVIICTLLVGSLLGLVPVSFVTTRASHA